MKTRARRLAQFILPPLCIIAFTAVIPLRLGVIIGFTLLIYAGEWVIMQRVRARKARLS